MSFITGKQFFQELKQATKLTWQSKRLWYLGFLTSFLFSAETVPLTWGFRILLDTDGILGLWNIVIRATLLSSRTMYGTIPKYLEITGLLFLTAFPVINFFLALSAETLILKINNASLERLFGKKTWKVFALAMLFKLAAFIVFTLFLWALSYHQTLVFRVLFSTTVLILLSILLIIGALSAIKVVTRDIGIFKSISASFGVFISRFCDFSSFFFLMALFTLVFSISMILIASILILPLAVVGIIFYSTQAVAPFWGVVITSLILLSILLILSTSFFTILRVRLWNWACLKTQI